MAKVFLCLAMLLALAAQELVVATKVAEQTEGPTVDREGNVYFSEMPLHRIMKLRKDGAEQIDGRKRARIEGDRFVIAEPPLVGEENAEHRSVRRDGNIVNNLVIRRAQ